MLTARGPVPAACRAPVPAAQSKSVSSRLALRIVSPSKPRRRRKSAALRRSARSRVKSSPKRRRTRFRACRRRSEEHTSELQSLLRISYAVFCLKKKRKKHVRKNDTQTRNQSTKSMENENER